MKKLLLFMFAVVAFAACEQAPIEEAQGVVMIDRSLEVSFEGADDTRIQLQGGKTVWTEDDHVSVFYRSSVNEEWQFMGETGDRTGQIVPVDNSVNPPATHNRVVVIYPYNNEYYLNTETYSIEASLPAVQNYLEDSYGTNGNIMVSSNDYKQVSLKSVCGWLKLQLTGDGEVVKSITLRGNNGEQVAGELHINTSDATCVLASASGDAGESEVGGTLVHPGTILTEVTLDCGEGVTLGKNATVFYIALPPQTFEKGFTLEIEDTEGYVMEQSTDKTLLIERNTILPMKSFEFVNPNTPSTPMPANNEIWYTATAKVNPLWDDVFGATIVSNIFDSNTGKGIITFNDEVTSIGEKAFSTCSITSITMPNSVTKIGNDAFHGCYRLESVAIGESVTTIGNGAFSSCSSLTSVTIPDSVTTIGNNVFYGCSGLVNVSIPDNVTMIGDYAFFCCSNLANITIPDSVTTIGDRAFEYCSSLTSVTIPDSVTTIGYSAFRSCKNLAKFNGKFSEDSGRILVVDSTLVAFAPAGLTEYVIPDSVTTIDVYVFYGCDSLTSVTIPDSITSIESNAFSGCSDLRSITIPNSVTAIGYQTFWGCHSLTSVAIPDSVNTIGYEAFSSCTGLISVTIGCRVTTIDNYAFRDCRSLTSVTIGDSVTTIGNGAFSHCRHLTSITIPDSVTTIGDSAFYYCLNLANVYCKATTPPALGDDTFYDNASDRKIYVPTESVDAYKSAVNWSEYADAIVGYDF